MKVRYLELWVLRTIESSSYSWGKPILYVLSLCFQGLVKLKAYSDVRTCKKRYVSKIPVVCIGNITAGGTGKTPLVEKLAQDLKEHIPLAVISTGYRSLGVTRHDVITPRDRKNRLVTPSYCGDEPYLLHQHLPDVPIFVSKNRKKALEIAHLQDKKLALLDDGFQRRSIAKDLIVVVLTARDLFGKGYYLPRGFLRDSPERLEEADFLCLTGTGVTREDLDQMTLELKAYSSAPIMVAEMTPQKIKGAKTLSLETIKGKKVGVFCGIGRPESYMETVQTLGVEPVATLIAPDHCLPHPKRFNKFLQIAYSRGAEMVLCTEKDFVKITDSQYNALPVCYVESKLNIVHGVEHYEALKNEIIALIK
jgi:tetraacyldisaccharide 4'-kinase